MNYHSFCRICAFIILTIYAVSSAGLIVRLSDLHTMAKRSDIVIHGYVGDQRVSTDDLGRLITLTDIEVVEGLYGAKTGNIITVYQVGGQKDGLVVPLIGGHRYNIGQEIILFGLEMGDSYVSYGVGQGKFDIDEKAGQEIVIEDLGDVSAMNNNMPGANIFQPTPLSYPSKSMLKDEIRLMIESR